MSVAFLHGNFTSKCTLMKQPLCGTLLDMAAVTTMEEKVWPTCWLLKLLPGRDTHHCCPHFSGQSRWQKSLLSSVGRGASSSHRKEIGASEARLCDDQAYNLPPPSVTSCCFEDKIQNPCQAYRCAADVLSAELSTLASHLSILQSLYSNCAILVLLTCLTHTPFRILECADPSV